MDPQNIEHILAGAGLGAAIGGKVFGDILHRRLGCPVNLVLLPLVAEDAAMIISQKADLIRNIIDLPSLFEKSATCRRYLFSSNSVEESETITKI